MAKRIPAGQMRHKVYIKQHKLERGSTAYDSYGQISASTTAWSDLTTRRAKIEPLTGQDAVLARQIYPSATYKITIDYDAILASTGGARRAVVFGSRWLFVGAVSDPDMEHYQLELLCGEER